MRGEGEGGWRGVVFWEGFHVELRVQCDLDAAVCWHCGDLGGEMLMLWWRGDCAGGRCKGTGRVYCCFTFTWVVGGQSVCCEGKRGGTSRMGAKLDLL